METGQLINFNNGIFKIVFVDDDEIRLQRTIEPKITVWGLHKKNEKKIKLIGWKKYAVYKLT